VLTKNAVRYTGFLSIIMRVDTSAAQAHRTSVSDAHRAARFYIKLTLFAQSDLEREVDKPSRYSVPLLHAVHTGSS
jgi:hypothetical protein